MVSPRSTRHSALRSVMLLLALLPGFALADDSGPAAVRWSLLGSAETDSHDSEAAAVQFGCEKLRKKPPTSVNSETRIGRCGDAVSTTANARNYRVSYTLLSHDRTLNHDTTTESSFLIQRKAWCPSAEYPHLREDDSSRFRYSCWRCPSSELRPMPPRFVSDQVVRWFRSNQCPLDFDQTLTDAGTKVIISKNRYQQKLPLATDLTVADDATLRWLRDAPYGRLAELQLGSGERVFFIGDGVAGSPLTPANSKHGSLIERDGQWLWLMPQQIEYRFGASEEGLSKVSVKRGRDGKLWHYRWQRVGKAGTSATVLASLYRLDTLIDHSNQRYQFRYDQRGKLASLIMQAAGVREQLALNKTD